MSRLFLFVLALVVCFSGCVSSLPHYIYTRNKVSENIGITIPVYIDKTFSSDDKISIDNALNAWNYALNGYIKFSTISTEFDLEPSNIQTIKETSALVVMKLNSGSYLIPAKKPGKTIMAFTTALRFVYVVRDTFDDQQQLQEVIIHELGHALGSGHSEKDNVLMSPGFNRDYEQCVDRDAIERVAKAQRLNVNRLNYCSYE